jgi:FkbM family methyltransferase
VVLDWFDGLRLTVHLGNDLSRQIFVGGCIDPNEFTFLHKVLEPGMTFLDAGANEGVYTVFAAECVGNTGAVWAFEPSQREFKRLQQNLKLNRLKNVHPFPLALAEHEGKAELAVAEAEHSGHNTLGKFAYDSVGVLRKEPVPVHALDQVVQETAITRIDVMKLDVEGAEHRLLEGAQRALQRFRPIILFEASDAALRHQGSSREALCAALSAQACNLYVFDSSTGLPAPATSGQFSDNMIAVPVEKPLPRSVFEVIPRSRQKRTSREKLPS